MKIINDGRRLFVRDYTTKEGMELKRRGVNLNFDKKYNCIVAEDNVFNRILLGISCDFLFTDLDVKSISLNEYTREYQVKDIEKMLKSKNILNRNRMGYGKTFEAIEYCRALKLQKILVICPKSVIVQWKEQFEKWWTVERPEFREHPTLRNSPQIVITNYESLGTKKNIGMFQELKSVMWDVIVCDESHRIKNPKSIRAMRVKELPTVRKVALTGTPILNRPDDLWNQLNWFGDKYSGRSYWSFVERFCEIEEDHWGKKPIGLTPSDSARSLLSQVLSLVTVGGDNYKLTQGKNYIEMPLEMGKKQKAHYRDLQRLALDTLNAQGITIKNAMDQMVKLQMCTSAGIEGEDNPKFKWLQDWLEDSGVEQVVVFSQFTTTLKSLQTFLGKDVVEIYHGQLSAAEREKAKQRFIKGEVRVLAGTIGALGTGVDGLQNVCSNVVFIDLSWSPAINEQAEDRVNRSGQKGMTNVYILRLKGSVDAHIEEVVNHKSDDVEALNKWIESWC